MAKHEIPTPEQLRKLLRYDPETGFLYWREREVTSGYIRRFNMLYVGQLALHNINAAGYRNGSVNHVTLKAHRVIWAMTTGAWPENDIDHIDGDRTNNRMDNLRSVSRLENGRNQKLHTTNTSGITGVSWVKRSNRWEAYINHGGLHKYLGRFKTLDAARDARKAAEHELGFHPNHGVRR